MSPGNNIYPQSLPANPYSVQGDIYTTAYEHCLRLESRPGWNFKSSDPSYNMLQDMSPNVCARVLGHGLRLSPDDAGRKALARDVLACHEDQELLAGLAHLYVFGLIRVFYNPNGPTPAVTPSLTPPEAAAQSNPSSSSSASELHDLLMLRDEYRCVFTGRLDPEEYEKHRSKYSSSTALAVATNVAHIISQSLSDNMYGVTQAIQAKFTWAMTAGGMIAHIGGFDAQRILGDANLHSPKNAFILSHDAHAQFNKLDLYLTPVKDVQEQVIPDTYNAEHAYGEDYLRQIRLELKDKVTFRSCSVDAKVIPAPDPKIIALHAACAKIAHMSGAAEYLRELYRDTDAIAVMTEPNAASELSRALKTLQTVSAMA
ncbi:hypothetical protein L226DRAFT_613839 [Lentinus tigrinus ALCF2SS1-7]|uniref:HNH nuclease domain-containing protein n=1 Tax=Lentinus tigrinus ALCF2SS1-6 TaxID=1328759 RepID=A0A5C2RPL8_9APHY|nr:hypothetical protein L227DRAFT_581240 [Lentinus tigrinus ALCF2SS1-6]RPD73690.1 hypothetical protein L226DRAFT_613839 [Lentinus tigrinus ALCF2SS1-7]